MMKTKKHLRLLYCPKCSSADINIVIALPILGRVGAKVECVSCGHKTAMHNIHKTILTETGLSTPITIEAIEEGVKKAVEEWGYFYEVKENETY